MDQAGRDERSRNTMAYWESWGYLRVSCAAPATDVRMVSVPANAAGLVVRVRDRDTNNNGIADVWEYAVTGFYRFYGKID